MDTNEEKDIEFEATEEGEAESFAKDKIKDLREKLKACEKDKQEYLNGWQRERADFANYRKSEDERKVMLMDAAKERILLSFLNVMDSFDMAFANREAWEKVDANWRKGVEYIYAQMNTVFEDYGIKAIGQVGEMFNPEMHQSIDTVETTNPEDDHKISDVVQKGYRSATQVLRPARVKVFSFK